VGPIAPSPSWKTGQYKFILRSALVYPFGGSTSTAIHTVVWAYDIEPNPHLHMLSANTQAGASGGDRHLLAFVVVHYSMKNPGVCLEWESQLQLLYCNYSSSPDLTSFSSWASLTTSLCIMIRFSFTLQKGVPPPASTRTHPLFTNNLHCWVSLAGGACDGVALVQ